MDRILDKDLFHVTLAALLHDIGKPMQRAAFGDENSLSSYSLGMKGLVGRNNRPYSHCLWTSEFFNSPAIRNVFEKLCDIYGINLTHIENSAVRHHNPDADNIFQNIIGLADKASAGTDRESDDDQQLQPGVELKYYEKPLESLFTRVHIEGKKEPTRHYYRANELTGLESIFPGRERRPVEYQSVVDGFIAEFQQIASSVKSNPSLLIETIASLLIRWFSLIPSSTIENHADIPLSDHLLSTASIAAVLASFWKETGEMPGWKTPLRLVAGDFSGIQNFIFASSGESNRQMAKLIRGRSFMVNMYCQLSARYITDSCGLPPLCCIGSVGGRFLILVPDTMQARKRFSKAKGQIEQWAFDRFFGDLSILIDDGVPFTLDNFKMEKFREVLLKSGSSINEEKNRRFATILSGGEKKFINDRGWHEYKTHGACPVCGREPASGESEKLSGVNCRQFIQCGERLVRERFVSVYTDGEGIFGKYRLQFGKPATAEHLEAVWGINPSEKAAKEELWPEMHYANTVPFVEAEDTLPEEETEAEESLRCKTFEDLSQGRQGLDAIAIIKADVDNMGFIFSDGFGNAISLSRRVGLSRMLNWFFCGYLPALLKNSGEFKNIYTVFAGGDDLCLIGRWDDIIQFSVILREKFRAYTGFNDSVTISAGIKLFKAGFPVGRAVESADSALEQAKNSGRDRISLFDLSMRWDREYESQLKFAADWRGFIARLSSQGGELIDGKKRISMLYRFLSYWEKYNSLKDSSSLERLAHRFRFIYDISRNFKQKRGEEDQWPGNYEPLRSLLADLVGHDGFENRPLFQFLRVGITVAMYTMR